MRLKLRFFSDANELNKGPEMNPKVRVRLKLGVLRYMGNICGVMNYCHNFLVLAIQSYAASIKLDRVPMQVLTLIAYKSYKGIKLIFKKLRPL